MPVTKQNDPAATELDASLVELYRKSRAEEFGVAAVDFATILDEVVSKNLQKYSAAEKQDFFNRLHLEDLILARACALGNQRAWEVFMLQFREKLYDTARQITRDDSTGKELAD